ncbi:MAG: hypothetical protein CVU89_08865 [Firmicutes bacterium HGW-Firmicutes-14]|nr:MAG: hypothetical protein CVU89_08865 [Firmicutes bacterium HGW-Firmicutes-14]
MELKHICGELEKVFPIDVAGHNELLNIFLPVTTKSAHNYEPLSFIFPAINHEAGINVRKYYEKQFLRYYNGLMIKGENEVSKIFCVVFPNTGVMCEVLSRCGPGDLIFTHHCCGFEEKKGFLPISREVLELIRAKRVSVYSLHVPFDFNGPWSPSVCLAETLGMELEGEFAPIVNKPTGVFGTPPVTDLHSLVSILRIRTGAEEITVIGNRKNLKIERIAVIAGGRAYENLVEEAHGHGCDTFLTGTAIEDVKIDTVKKANERFLQKARELEINVIGGGHYYTEKPALERMTEFFSRIGVEAEFVPE